jgi:hypothetical protein
MPLPRIAADENISTDIINALRRERPDIDIVRVVDVGLSGVDDQAILEWAAGEDRVLITHDVNTMTRYAYDRLAAGQYLAGMIQVKTGAGFRKVIEDILICLEVSTAQEWQTMIQFVPFSDFAD